MNKNDTLDVSIVLPTYNEAKNFEPRLIFPDTNTNKLV